MTRSARSAVDDASSTDARAVVSSPPTYFVRCNDIVMFKRTRLAALIITAAGTPYVVTETDLGRGASDAVVQMVSTDGSTVNFSDEYAIHSHHEVEALRAQDPQRYRYEADLTRKLGGSLPALEDDNSLVGGQIPDLREVLRFDINDRWVIERFARVSTVLADTRLEGLRVPIVTGTQASDLAGTLTYYFDHGGVLQRIQLHGFTGDPSRLIQAMTQFYGLKPEPTLEAGVYTKRWNGMPVQFLRLTHAPVVYSDAVHQKYTVFIELNQPNLGYGISEEAQRIIHADRNTGRW